MVTIDLCEDPSPQSSPVPDTASEVPRDSSVVPIAPLRGGVERQPDPGNSSAGRTAHHHDQRPGRGADDRVPGGRCGPRALLEGDVHPSSLQEDDIPPCSDGSGEASCDLDLTTSPWPEPAPGGGTEPAAKRKAACPKIKRMPTTEASRRLVDVDIRVGSAACAHSAGPGISSAELKHALADLGRNSTERAGVPLEGWVEFVARRPNGQGEERQYKSSGFAMLPVDVRTRARSGADLAALRGDIVRALDTAKANAPTVRVTVLLAGENRPELTPIVVWLQEMDAELVRARFVPTPGTSVLENVARQVLADREAINRRLSGTTGGPGDVSFLGEGLRVVDFHRGKRPKTLQAAWASMLMCIPGVCPSAAEAVVGAYPTFRRLREAFGTSSKPELLLEPLGRKTETGRRVGPAASKKIYHFFTSAPGADGP